MSDVQSKYRTEIPQAKTENITATPVFHLCASPVPEPAFSVVDGDDVSTPPAFEVGAAVKVPGDPPLRVCVTVPPCEMDPEDKELERVLGGVEELVCSGEALFVVEATVADPVPLFDPPETTPVYVALKAERTESMLDGTGAIVPPLYWLHAEVLSSSSLMMGRS